MIRATIDVNVLLSAVIGPLGMSRQIILAFAAAMFMPIVSDRMVAELGRKLQDQSITRRFQITNEDHAWIFGLLSAYATVIPVSDADIRVVTRDPEDDGVLAVAVMGGSDYLVTGDKGLLALGEYEGAKIVSPRDYMTVLREVQGKGLS